MPELEGKANKRERTAVNKEIYALENDEAYVAAVKAATQDGREAAAAADLMAHKLKLQREEEERTLLNEEAAARRKERVSNEAEEEALSPSESHISVRRIKKGDGMTRPTVGDMVGVCYSGLFAEGTQHQGTDYSGQLFDSSVRKEEKPPYKKVDTPLVYTLEAEID